MLSFFLIYLVEYACSLVKEFLLSVMRSALPAKTRIKCFSMACHEDIVISEQDWG
jgi:hypothetical protein